MPMESDHEKRVVVTTRNVSLSVGQWDACDRDEVDHRMI
jgi:hypothetical protein